MPLFQAAHREYEKNGGTAALRLAGEVQVVLLFVLLVLVAAFEVMMPSIVMLLAPGLSATPERFGSGCSAQITMPYLPMISLVAFWAALANAHDRFVPGAAMPIIFNLCMISGALVIHCVWRAWGGTGNSVAFGLLGAGVLQIAIMYVVLHRMGKMPKFVLAVKPSPESWRMWQKFLPAALAAFGGLNLVVDLDSGLPAASWGDILALLR